MLETGTAFNHSNTEFKFYSHTYLYLCMYIHEQHHIEQKEANSRIYISRRKSAVSSSLSKDPTTLDEQESYELRKKESEAAGISETRPPR